MEGDRSGTKLKNYIKRNSYRCCRIIQLLTTVNRPDLMFIISNYTLIRITIYRSIFAFTRWNRVSTTHVARRTRTHTHVLRIIAARGSLWYTFPSRCKVYHKIKSIRIHRRRCWMLALYRWRNETVEVEINTRLSMCEVRWGLIRLCWICECSDKSCC